MRGRLNGWAGGFLRWVSYVAPLLAAMAYIHYTYMPRESVALMKQVADDTHALLAEDVKQVRDDQAAMVQEVAGLREEMSDLTGQIAALNAYLAAQTGAPFAPPPKKGRR